MKLKRTFSKAFIEAGCDEAGRGCLSGPVVAAAVVFPKGFYDKEINDSKKLSEKNRRILAEKIKSKALCYGIAEVDVETIDSHNILNASIHAMHLALEKLSFQPELILVDGNRFSPYAFTPHECIVGGDAKYLSIAAASILAKDYRDCLMDRLHQQYPQYGWKSNRGYATRSHREALMQHGPCIHHRKSFRLDYSVEKNLTKSPVVLPTLYRSEP